MSVEFQLAWTCPHLIQDEYVILSSDRRSLVTLQPVANAGTARLMANDIPVPTTGLFSQARLSSSISGPYDLMPGYDELIVKTSLGTWSYQFQFSSQTRLSADQILQKLLKANLNVAVAEVYNGFLVFSDTSSVGSASYVEVSGSVAPYLGFGAVGINSYQRRAEGKMLLPPWQLYTPPTDTSLRYPRFTSPVSGNPVFKVSYTANPRRCPRCAGSYVENDVRAGTAGQLLLVQDENLLYQAALKILLTEKGSNPYHSWYGTDLQSRIGAKAVAGMTTILAEDVRKALSEFQKLQVSQAKYQVVSAKERLYSIVGVQVKVHDQDPSTFLVDVLVRNGSNTPVSLSIVYTAPQVVALMGSNGLMLGTEAVGV